MVPDPWDYKNGSCGSRSRYRRFPYTNSSEPTHPSTRDMETVTCLEIAKFVLEQPSLPKSLAGGSAPNDPRYVVLLPRRTSAWVEDISCSLRYGLESQDAENLYLLRGEFNLGVDKKYSNAPRPDVAWDTARSLHTLSANITHESDTRIYPTIPGKLAYRFHVHLKCEPYTALSAPLTEIVLWKMREGVKKETVEQLLTKLMSIVNKIPSKEGLYKAGWGRVMNDDPEWQFVVMIGWTDMEVKRFYASAVWTGGLYLRTLGVHYRCARFSSWASCPGRACGGHRSAPPTCGSDTAKAAATTTKQDTTVSPTFPMPRAILTRCLTVSSSRSFKALALFVFLAMVSCFVYLTVYA